MDYIAPAKLSDRLGPLYLGEDPITDRVNLARLHNMANWQLKIRLAASYAAGCILFPFYLIEDLLNGLTREEYEKSGLSRGRQAIKNIIRARKTATGQDAFFIEQTSEPLQAMLRSMPPAELERKLCATRRAIKENRLQLIPGLAFGHDRDPDSQESLDNGLNLLRQEIRRRMAGQSR